MIVVKTSKEDFAVRPKNADNFSFSVNAVEIWMIYYFTVCLFQVDLATELEQAKSQIMTHASEIAQVSGFASLETRRKLGRVESRKDFWDCN